MALQHLRSSTANKRPVPSGMADGQLAINSNLASPGLFLKDSNGDLVKVGPVHIGTTAPNVSPASGGQAGNSKGEQWLDTASSRYVFKVWDGTAWRTQDGEFVNVTGDTMTGALVMDNQQQVQFRETTANGTNYIALQATASVASDKIITLPDITGTVITTGDTGSVTSTMILDGTIVNADINASAAIVDTKLATIATAGKVSNSATTATSSGTVSTIVARDSSGNFAAGTITATLAGNASTVTTNANLTGDITSSGNATSIATGVIVNDDVNASAAIAGSKISPNFGSQTVQTTGIFSVAAGTAGAPSVAFTGDTDTGFYSPGVNQAAISTAGSERLRITSAGLVGIGTSSPGKLLHVAGSTLFGASAASIGHNFKVNNDVEMALYSDAAGHIIFDCFLGSTPATKQNLYFNKYGGYSLFGSRVGIGTTSPATTLDINGDTTIYGATVGRGAGAIASNTVVGNGALAANTTGSSNVANGFQALQANTTGFSNTAVGNGALTANTTGTSNVANGFQALAANTTGIHNVANGYQALAANTTGNSNVANGFQALAANTTASNNTANGYQALVANTTGANNTANGFQALAANTTGGSNVANGFRALQANTTGGSNVANGVQALAANTTGVENTAIGHQSLFSNTTGNYNVAQGIYALYATTSGITNTGIGTSAGSANTTGSNNTFIGNNSQGASTTASNVITLGNNAIATLRCQVTTITSLSDARDKTNIVTIPAGLDFINALRPVAFDWNTRDGQKVGIHEFGFIAQELQEAQESTGITVPNLVSTENPEKLEASAGTLLPVLVSAVQELTTMVKDLQEEIAALKAE